MKPQRLTQIDRARPDHGVRASLKLSYDLLTPEQQERWRTLAIFPATFAGLAAAALWEIREDQAQEMLGDLFLYSLIEWDATNSRYRLHDLVRLFARELLLPEELETAQRRHASHYSLLLADADESYLTGGEESLRGLRLFDTERENMVAGQRWAESMFEEDTEAAQLSLDYAINGIYTLSLRLAPRQRIEWLEIAGAAARRLRRRADEGHALGNPGNAYTILGQARQALEYHEQALAISRELGDRVSEAQDLGNIGLAYDDLGHPRKAIKFYKQALQLHRELGNRRGEASDLGNIGGAHATLRQYRQAIKCYEQHLSIAREIEDRRSESYALGGLGVTYYYLNENAQAVEYFHQWLAITREMGDRPGEANALGDLGISYLALGETQKAIDYHQQALAINRELGNWLGEAGDLKNLSTAWMVLGDIPQTIALAKASLKIYEQIGAPEAELLREQLAEWEA